MRAGARIRLTLFAALLAALPATAEPRLVAVLDWDHPDPRHGGLSAVEVAADGVSLLAMSDRGTMVRAEVVREGGVPTALRTLWHADLLPPEDRPMPEPTDTEGLAIPGGGLDGRSFVSFEWIHRMWSWPGLDGPEGTPARRIPIPRALAGLPGNGGPEALAALPDGRILALTEDAGPEGHEVVAWHDGSWTRMAPLPPDDGWKPVGADAGPDGRLYLLERRIARLAFQSRIRRFAVVEAYLAEPETLLVTQPGDHGNLEGIALWTASDGLRAILVSDDNFRDVFRGELVEYVLD